MVIIRTNAYNAENTIERTIRSVLAQTYGNFRYYIIDDCSTDGTSDIIAKYAEKDDRIRMLRNEINSFKAVRLGVPASWGPAVFLEYACRDYPEGRYFCLLDADDEYLPTFFEKAIDFIATNKLDIVGCGTYTVSEETGEPTGKDRFVSRDLLLQGDEFMRHISEYIYIMTAVWGKMYSLTIAQKWYYEDKIRTRLPHGILATDTIAVTRMFGYADRVGILAAKLHRQYKWPMSLSRLNEAHIKRLYFPHVHHKVHSDFLRQKGGRIPPRLKDSYEYYVKYSFGKAVFLLGMEIPFRSKISGMVSIISTYTKTVSFWGLLATFGCAVKIFWRRRQHRRKATNGRQT